MSTLNIHATILSKQLSRLHSSEVRRASKVCPVPCTAPAARLRASCSAQQEARRSGNYQPAHWDFSYIQSLNTQYNKVSFLSTKHSRMILNISHSYTIITDIEYLFLCQLSWLRSWKGCVFDPRRSLSFRFPFKYAFFLSLFCFFVSFITFVFQFHIFYFFTKYSFIILVLFCVRNPSTIIYKNLFYRFILCDE